MWFIYALLGAFGKSYSGFFRKKMAGNISPAMFMWFSYTLMLVLLIPFVVTRFSVIERALTTTNSLLILFGAAVSLMIATLLNLEALKREELSYTAPLNAFVPVFALAIGYIFLGEHPPLPGFAGVGAVFVGAYIVSLRSGRVRWYDPITHLVTSPGAQLSIGVALGYAINSAFLKAASNQGYDQFVLMFTTTAIGWLLLCYVPFTKKAELRNTLRSSKVVLAGAIISSFAGNFFNILAIAGTYVSYAVGVRRFEAVISVLLGWRYLKETNIRSKLIGSIIMTAGAIIMAVGR